MSSAGRAPGPDGSTPAERASIVDGERRRLGIEPDQQPRRRARNKTEPTQAPKKKRPPAKARAKKTAATVKRKARRTGRTLKPAATPLRTARTGTVAGLLLATVGLSFLYQFLIHAESVVGFLGGLQKALRWLADPNLVIKFKE